MKFCRISQPLKIVKKVRPSAFFILAALLLLAQLTTLPTPAAADATVSMLSNFDATSGLSNFTSIGGTLYFRVGNSADVPQQLWKSDGTAQGTVQISTPGVTLINDLTNVNGTLYFEADDPAHGSQLWKSDGTADGTVRITDYNPNDGLLVGGPYNVSGTVYFVVFRQSNHYADQLWKTDGTTAGTVLVQTAILLRTV